MKTEDELVALLKKPGQAHFAYTVLDVETMRQALSSQTETIKVGREYKSQKLKTA